MTKDVGLLFISKHELDVYRRPVAKLAAIKLNLATGYKD